MPKIKFKKSWDEIKGRTYTIEDIVAIGNGYHPDGQVERIASELEDLTKAVGFLASKLNLNDQIELAKLFSFSYEVDNGN